MTDELRVRRLALCLLAVAGSAFFGLVPFHVTVDGIRESCGPPAFFALPSDPIDASDRERRVFEACQPHGLFRVAGAMGLAVAALVIVERLLDAGRGRRSSMKLKPEDGGRRLLIIAAIASALGGLMVGTLSAIAGTAGAVAAAAFLAGAFVVQRRRSRKV